MPTYNKIVINGEEILNLDNDTVSSTSQIANGVTFHLNNGEQATGIGEYAGECSLNGSLIGIDTGVSYVTNATSVGRQAFSGSINLTSIDVSNATTIGGNAFCDCTSLQSIDVSNATTIGHQTFQNCTSLQSIDVSNATTISNMAFCDCTSLQSIDVSNATSIGNSVFGSCTSLQSIDVSNATTIGWGVFYNCTNLTSITIKNGVVCAPHSSNTVKFATFNNHLYWQKGYDSNAIYISDAIVGEPTRTLIGTLTSSNPSFTYTDGPYTITFTRIDSYNNFSISWTETP